MAFVSTIKPFDHLLGKIPDERIAEMADAKPASVANRRRSMGIAAFGTAPEPERAREDDGTFKADDPETPDVNEAFVQPTKAEPKVSTPDDEVSTPDNIVQEPAVVATVPEPEPEDAPPPRVALLTQTFRCRPRGTHADRFFPRSIYRGGVLAKLWDVIPHDLFEVIEE